MCSGCLEVQADGGSGTCWCGRRILVADRLGIASVLCRIDPESSIRPLHAAVGQAVTPMQRGRSNPEIDSRFHESRRRQQAPDARLRSGTDHAQEPHAASGGNVPGNSRAEKESRVNSKHGRTASAGYEGDRPEPGTPVRGWVHATRTQTEHLLGHPMVNDHAFRC